jgi:hypothetical protein
VSERKTISAVVTWRVALNSPLSRMSARAKHVGLSLANYMSEAGDHAFPSPETLHEDSGMAESTIRSALVELQRGGWIVKTRQGGGRGKTNEWASTIPDSFWETVELLVGRETRRDAAAFRAARALARERSQSLHEAALATATAPSTEGPGSEETRRAPAGLADGKPAGGLSETRRERQVNPPDTGAEVEDLEVAMKEQQQGDAVVVDAAAAGLDRDLRRHHIAADVRSLALADPERARAWLELGMKEARENVGGFVADGIRGGEWPSPRGESIAGERKHRGRVDSLRNLVAAGHVDEAHELVDDWSTLTQVERNEYHELVVELASDQLPEAPAIESVRGAA